MNTHSGQIPFRISVCARVDIDTFAGKGITHILSIDNPRDPTETPHWFSGIHRHVAFQDVESMEEARTFNATPPSKNDVRQILDCGSECLKASANHGVHLLVHCLAGASRSPAAAYAIVAMVLGEHREVEALRYILQIKEDAFPNKLVVQYADSMLKRNGKMLQALGPLREEVNRDVDSWAEAMRKRRERRTEPPPAPRTRSPERRGEP